MDGGRVGAGGSILEDFCSLAAAAAEEDASWSAKIASPVISLPKASAFTFAFAFAFAFAVTAAADEFDNADKYLVCSKEPVLIVGVCDDIESRLDDEEGGSVKFANVGKARSKEGEA